MSNSHHILKKKLIFIDLLMFFLIFPIISPICLPHVSPMKSHDFPRKVLELFAGIGGWRLALSAAADTTPSKSKSAFAVTAYDSGPHCSEAWEGPFIALYRVLMGS